MNTHKNNSKREQTISGDTMIFADEIVFWTNKKGKLKQALAVLNVCIKEAGLKRNTRKAKILTISKTLDEPVDNEI